MVLSLKTKLAASIVVVVIAMGIVSTIVGTRLFGDGLVQQVQSSVEQDLNTAYLVYSERLRHTQTLVRLLASEPEMARSIAEGRSDKLAVLLSDRMNAWGLDILSATDADGGVIARGLGGDAGGVSAAGDPVVRRVLDSGECVCGTVLVPLAELALESPELAELAGIRVLDTPRARPSRREALDQGMLLKAGAPVIVDGAVVGTLYGALLLNGREEMVDQVKETAYGGEQWRGKDIGTATIFQDDVRIATNVIAADGRRAIGTRVSQEVYDRVVGEGERWIARAFVVEDWYITAYGPIRDIDDNVIGLLYVGVLAGKFDEHRKQVVWTFAGVSVAGMALALLFASILSTGILRPVRTLADASERIARGDFETRVSVDKSACDEFVGLADAFNFMTKSVAERDAKLQENARKMTESKKLATLGQLAAGIAHEINNPLGGIVMYSHMLLDDLKQEENLENVQKIGREADRCKKIVKGLLDFARQTKPERIESNINHVMNEVIALLEHQAIFHNIEIVKDHGTGIPLADIDVAQIQEVFMNLILNSAQAMEGRGTLTTRTRLSEDGRAIEISVSDTGPGIPPKDIDKIFEPFYTTKEVGRGTGLGLSIAYGIVERHHGSIRVESNEGTGTTFHVRLPLPEPPPEM